jgi:hypothetical protein
MQETTAMTTRVRQAAACLVVLAALAAACGGDDDDAAAGGGSGGDTTTTAEGSGGERSADDLDADQAAAEKMLLTIGDFPSGWQAQPDEGEDDGEGGGGSAPGEPSDDELTADLAECLHVDAGELSDDDDPSAESPSFQNADEDEASVEVAFAASPEQATSELATLQRDEAPGCFGEVYKTLFTQAMKDDPSVEGVEVGDPQVEAAPLGDLGDDTAAFRVTIPLSAAGQQIVLYQDIAFVKVGRAEITGFFQASGQPFDAELSQRLLQAVIDRAPEE